MNRVEILSKYQHELLTFFRSQIYSDKRPLKLETLVNSFYYFGLLFSLFFFSPPPCRPDLCHADDMDHAMANCLEALLGMFVFFCFVFLSSPLKYNCEND